jgi:hypothetical protein
MVARAIESELGGGVPYLIETSEGAVKESWVIRIRGLDGLSA